MSVSSEIERLQNNISDAYDEANALGADEQSASNSDNLASAIRSIGNNFNIADNPSGGVDVTIKSVTKTLATQSDISQINGTISDLQTALLGVSELIGGDE